MAEHIDLPEGDLHEPKGISAALVGQILSADGVGSGSWADAVGFANNIVVVNELADFPTPSVSVITLAAATTYCISGNIDLGTNRLILSAASALVGTNRFADRLTYTGTAAFISSSDSHLIHSLGLVCANSKCFDLSGGSTETFVYSDTFIINCDSIGTIANWSTSVFRSFSSVSSNNVTNGGLLYSGTCKALNMDNGLWQGLTTAGTILDLGSATFDRVQIPTGNRFNAATGVTALSGAVGNGNLNAAGRGIVTHNIFEGAGTFLGGITIDDTQWTFTGNGGLEDSSVVGSFQKDAGRTNTVLITSTAVKIAGTSTISGEEERVDSNGSIDNLLRYTGVDSTRALISGSVVGQSAGGSAITCDLEAQTTSGSITLMSGLEFPTGSDAGFSFNIPIDLSTNETVELCITRTAGSQDFDCANFQCTVHGI
jgi:hypothetical protein